ncbi:SCO2524 family protein [Streptomyces sp. AK04-3B]|uniref:SCO2524 family protein n=1 Tax=Streptomyces sp. AK04-3B TaxID=3028650 RepID=UPI0029A2C722|nr:SCO2524 family protein [Streptomyces sp. AK04-3B]MDX3803745.1 SCO2524 family protein [Streptomyces sp. AK04-3B]
MQIKPRQHLLDMWQAVARHSFDGGEWSWGEWGGRSSVADAERLLCLLYPATEIAAFRLDAPDTTQPDVARALKNVGDASDIPVRLIEVLGEFMDRHRDEEGPAFAGGHYFAPADPRQRLTAEQRAVGVVDSYSMSVSLCLATLHFCQVFRGRTRRASTLARIDRLREDAGVRLTAAMVGLLRSFTVDVVDIASDQGQEFARLLGRGRLSDRQVLQRFQRRFTSLRAVITESLRLGLDADVRDRLRDESRLFECGWAWSVVKDAPRIELEPATAQAVGGQPQGLANPVPYLHFTVVALDGIIDLFSERTLVLGLLTAEQQKLSDALRLRWELTQQYWSAIARFDDDVWPLEDIPWRTTHQQLESEYFSLTLVSILVHDRMRRPTTDHDLPRIIGVVERLAERGRLTGGTSRATAAIGLHSPGVTMPLLGSEALGPAMTWTMNDFSTQLLKRTVQLCALSRDIPSVDRLHRLAEDILDHVWERRIKEGEGVGLWDDVPAAHPPSPVLQGPLSWSLTERVTECMVAAHNLYDQPPIPSLQLSQLARDMISEAAHLLGREQEEHPAPAPRSPQGEEIRSIEADIRRARQLVDAQPATASALAFRVLRRLDALARARGV